MKFFLINLKKMKKRYRGNTNFIVHIKLVSLTFLKNKRVIKIKIVCHFNWKSQF